ncbi:SIMPL domain-containing protein [Novosphingobium sp. 1949]|uniref:SIMPL domain-containing protein n=1 Tax=Novosphingobium organovorum TaxID=2930092 RepID=A0ABT0B8Y7_9SPHN|nr:SIMPL domain-containing protein [Novosphingobium organovorum]MCJ2181389.1 SIMPL domain-containing protein [Novosphingobium organovorum]
MQRTMVSMALAGAVGLSVAAAAQARDTPQDEPSARILVSARGSVETPPDLAIVTYTLHGEGQTSDAALTHLQQRATAIEGALARFLKAKPDLHTGDLSIRAVRGEKCTLTTYGPARLSTDACAIQGYVADLAMTLRTDRVDQAGTLTGLIGRHEGLNPRIVRFELSDTSAAQREAMRKALGDAHEQADLIAQGTGAKLGPVLRIQDANYREVKRPMIEPARAAPPPPAPPAPPAVAIALRPAPITTSVQISVAYALAN